MDCPAPCGMDAVCALNNLCFDAIRANMRQGMTGLQLYDLVSHTLIARTGAAVPFAGDFLVGAESGGIEGPPSASALGPGGAVIADLLLCHGGFFSDTTRTFFASPPGAGQRAAYAAVRAALRAGEAMLRPGATGGAVFRAVDGALKQRGYAGLAHHAGHRVGGAWLEPPDFTPDCMETLREGMAVTLEPGLYFPGVFGVRVENCYLITTDGPRIIRPYPEEIEHFVLEGRSK